ncbi:RrF2 family transcriptional regulator [Candidatus Hadarchaeum sp.]|uniref:RrF2 family transcriptional regulator n=1 Tax=Candidatus Hadarchaeum sp. TaxID=2883567 RepID=UPI003857220E
MKVNKSLDYTLRLLLLLARDPGKFQSVRDLAQQEGLPEAFVRQVLLRLRKAGFLEAQKGRVGGYKLAKPPKRIRLAVVVRALDENLFLALAGEGRRRGLSQPEKDCPTAPFWDRLERTFWEALEETTLADLL